MQPTPKLNLLIVDDHSIVLAGLKALLCTDAGIDRVETASSSKEAIRLCGEFHPDVVLMDLRMPGEDGFSVMGSILERWPELRIIVLSGTASKADTLLARRIGAVGYLDKSVKRKVLVQTIQTVASGGTAFYNLPDLEEGVPALTGRELEVLLHLVRGLTNDDLGRVLGVGTETIKSHLRTIFVKLEVASRAEAVARAYELDLVSS